MKHVLALLPALICGCVVNSSDPHWAGGTVGPDYIATWSTVDARGIAGDCKAIADVVRVTAHDERTGGASVLNFDCRAKGGDIGAAVGPGASVRVELVDCDGTICFDGGSSIADFSVDAPPVAPGAAPVDLGPFAFDAL